MSDKPFVVVKSARSWSDSPEPVLLRFKNKKFTSYVCHWDGKTFADCENKNCKLCLSPDKPMVRYRIECVEYDENRDKNVEKIFDMPAHLYPDLLNHANSMRADEWRKTWWEVWREGAGIHLRYNVRKYVEDESGNEW